ncbi:TPA: OmpA family protein [Serratia fonticola]
MLKKYSFTRMAMALGGILFLAGCTHSVSQVDSSGTTKNPIFPEPATAVRTEGSFVNLDNLKQVRRGDTKAQLYELIGTPHFKEGVMRVKEWDYIFHFTKVDKSLLTCQYKVLFDSNMKAQSFYFLPQNCLSQLESPKAAEQGAHRDLSAESLFAFGSAVVITSGVAQIADLSANLKNESLDNKRVVITGHTDRFGSEEDNQRLSIARAESVKSLMVENGIPPANIDTEGMGSHEPRVYCPGSRSLSVIDCLAPNRRISVDVIEQ